MGHAGRDTGRFGFAVLWSGGSGTFSFWRKRGWRQRIRHKLSVDHDYVARHGLAPDPLAPDRQQRKERCALEEDICKVR